MNNQPSEVKTGQILQFRNNISDCYEVLENNQHEQTMTIQLIYPELPTQRRQQIKK